MFQCTPSVDFCLAPLTIFHTSHEVIVFVIIPFSLIRKRLFCILFTEIHHLHHYHINFTKHESTLKHYRRLFIMVLHK